MIWTLVTVSIIGVLWLAMNRKSNASIQKIAVEIHDLKDKKNIISKKGVLSKCRKHLGYDIDNSKIQEIDIRALEDMLNGDRRIKNSEVYFDNNDVLHISIDQRQPIVRVQNDDTAYYLDSEGEAIPLVKGAAVRVPIATGNIGKYEKAKIFSEKSSRLKDVFVMAKFIYEDDFLASLVEQIDVDQNGEFLLIPKVGKQELVFGKAEMIKDRFENLKIFYKEGMPKVGWRKFDKLVLNWEGQVLGRKE